MSKPAAAFTLVCAIAAAGATLAEPRSPPSFGLYADDPANAFDGYERTSQYVAARDGVRLAVDVYLPIRQGRRVEGRLPVVWTFTPYNRASRAADGSVGPPRGHARLLANGYAVAVADVRGKGASFGVRNGPADANETNDAYDITEWLAKQAWSSGKVGMNGCSYYGATALQAVRAKAPSLKAVFVGATMFDQYETFAHGGITSAGLLDDTVSANRVAEVDADKDRALVNQALKEHETNTPTGQFFASTPFRDDINPYTKDRWWEAASFYPYAQAINPDVGLYIYGGYYDVYSDQTITKFLNVSANAKLTYGAWPHCETPGFDMEAERLRFFDYWLKGVQNGVMSEPKVHLYMGRAADGTEWRALREWPAAQKTRYYLDSRTIPPSAERGAQASQNEAVLSAAEPPADAATIRVAPPPSVGPVVNYGMPRTAVDPYSVTFTLGRQERLRELVGSPVLRLWVSSNEADADVYVYLQAVRSNGGVEIISRGALRASHRKTGTAPYKTDGVPWQTHRRADAQPLQAGEPVALDIGLSPTTYTIRPGDQLRLAVTTRPPSTRADPAPPLTLHVDADHRSYIELPDVDTRQAAISPAGKAASVVPAGPAFGPVKR